ncbi:MAG: hypothetical protein E6Q33_02625 [Neisseriales bacterium]|nr:MAG: hypothetical protein E6Q33_02625 [Neisseriales bacterium]
MSTQINFINEDHKKLHDKLIGAGFKYKLIYYYGRHLTRHSYLKDDEYYYDLGFKVVHTAINRLQTAINTNQWKANNSRKMSLNLNPWQLEKYTKYIEEK